MPENQIAWNSDNKELKKKINQNNQTGKADQEVQLRKNAARRLRGRAVGRDGLKGKTGTQG